MSKLLEAVRNLKQWDGPLDDDDDDDDQLRLYSHYVKERSFKNCLHLL